MLEKIIKFSLIAVSLCLIGSTKVVDAEEIHQSEATAYTSGLDKSDLTREEMSEAPPITNRKIKFITLICAIIIFLASLKYIIERVEFDE